MVLSRALTALVAPALCAGATAAADPKPDPARQKAPTEMKEYVVRAVPGSGLALAPPTLPDLRNYTSAAVIAKVPKGPRGRTVVKRMVEVQTLREFVGGASGRLSEWAKRQTSNPRAILIEGGVVTPGDLVKALPSDQIAQTAPGVYVLRLPLVVTQGAALHIDASVKEFRLSQERGAFLSNDGQVFVTGTRLLAWRESDNKPAAFAGDGNTFRPFLISWGGSELYITDSYVAHLGYAASKAYGISISQYSPHMHSILKRPRPTGWILHSEFVDNWYGFYCYEADNIAIVGNTYRDNIVYGIDPHDRSRGLIIAGNTATGRQKHGIIISREVNDSWIIGNRANGNKLSGIVIDRNSSGNVVAYNEVMRNGTDGITIYESPKNLLWGNRAIGNGRHGYRLRNSVDIRLYDNVAVANGLAGIYGHVKDLTGTDRDPKLDPFEQNVSMVVVGGRLIFNGSGPVTIDRPLSMELYNVDLLAPSKRVGIQMTGVLGRYQVELLDILVRQRMAAVISPADQALPVAAAAPSSGT